MIVTVERLELVELITKYYGDANKIILLPFHDAVAERLASCICSLSDEQFLELKTCTDDCINHIKACWEESIEIGHPDSLDRLFLSMEEDSVRTCFRELFKGYGDLELGIAVGEGIVVNLEQWIDQRLNRKEMLNVRS